MATTTPPQQTPGKRRLIGIAAILTASITWGSIPLITRTVDGSPIITVFWRVTFGFLATSVYLLIKGKYSHLRGLDRKTIINLLAQGAVLGINWLLFIASFSYVNVAVGELLAYVGPALVAVLAPLTLKEERFNRRIILPLLLCLTGLVIVLDPRQLISTAIGGGSRQLLGCGFALSSAFTYAILMIRGKRFITNLDRDLIVWFEMFGGALIMLPLAIFSYTHGGAPSPTAQNYGLLLVLGTVHTASSSLLFYVGLQHLRADETAIFTYAEAVSAAFFAAAFLHEPLTLPTILGGALVVIGGTLVARSDNALPTSDIV